MPVTEIRGSLAAETLRGSAGDDLLLGADPQLVATTAPGFTQIAAGLGQALFATAMPGDAGRLFVAEKGGVVRIVDTATGAVSPTSFLDLTGQVSTSGEQGLLGFAFHPDFASNGRVFVHVSNLQGDSEIREYRVDSDDPDSVLPNTARVLLTIPQPGTFTNHKGGWIGFGPEGALYVATGDGGGGGDPLATGQNPNDLLGSILRIDVDRDDFPGDPGREYGIPAGNPFAAGGGAPEVWTFGLRNPFRDSFDRGTDTLWIADVGQGAREEIDLGAPGANYGWALYEGTLTYPGGAPAGSPPGITQPIFDYAHASGDRSVTGGYVQRGAESGLQGQYVFGDFVSGRIWALSDLDGDGSYTRTLLDGGGRFSGRLTSFGEDAEGNLHVTRIDGALFRLDAGSPTGTQDGNDRLLGGRGNDRAFGGAGNDLIAGDAGRDLLSGQEGDDTLRGGDDADSLIGGAGRDLLQGGAGGDTLLGGAGVDDVRGEAGDDLLVGGAGADRLIGGDGADRFRFTTAGDSPGFGGGLDRIADFDATEGDRIDLSGLIPGDFAFIGSGSFAAGGGAQVRAAIYGGTTRIDVTLDGVGVADLFIRLETAQALGADAFLL